MNKTFLMVISLIFFMILPALSQDKVHKYVGADKCKTCHKKEKDGKQYGLWQKGPHANALKALATPEAAKIAKEKGIADPKTDPKCTKCHSTYASIDAKLLDPKGKLKFKDGVSCESCHGAGSDYKKKKIMKDHALSVTNGLVEITEKTCTTCHNSESPTFKEFKFADASKEIAHPIPEKK